MEKVNWPWCNMKWDDIENSISSEIPKKVKFVKKYYDQAQGGTTIYIGDMFYYHETNSTKLLTKDQFDYKTYCEEMLQMHIEKLQGMGKNIRYVYINNARVSHWLADDGDTYITVKGIPIFLGSMLSGQRAMDGFSKTRLVDEIKSVINSRWNKDHLAYAR